MQFSVVIPTYNRAAELEQTLASLANINHPGSWEVIVVDNNSHDATPKLLPPLQRISRPHCDIYLSLGPEEARRSIRGLALPKAKLLLAADDDVRFEPDWLQQAAEALIANSVISSAAKVLPIWRGPRPAWLSDKGGQHWAVIALLDFGPEPVEFGKRYAPLGVNLAFKREAFDRAGLWDPGLGRKAGTLLGQEVREWMLRARDAGLQGRVCSEDGGAPCDPCGSPA